MAKDSYSLDAERRFYEVRPPGGARDYRWLQAYLDCFPGAGRLLTGRRILDIGAGECLYSALLAERYATSVVALELFPQRMAPAARTFRLRNLAFVAGDCHRLPFAEGCFDTVFGDLVLHHFPEPDRVIREVRRVLRSGGTYVGIEPNFNNPALRILQRFGSSSANERPHRPDGLRRAFAEEGFVVELFFFWKRFPQLRHPVLSSSVGIVAHSPAGR